MTPAKFTALAAIAGARDSKATQSARLVLVDGMAQKKAAKLYGITPQTVSVAVRRIKDAEALAVAAMKENENDD